MLDAAGPLGLTGARDHVLAAVLRLLCGWSRIRDDQVRIQQISDVIAEHAGTQLDPKTIGRALRDLNRAELIIYLPARGRGRCATIAIHARFLDGIGELARDTAGRVITFSRRRPYIPKGVNNPPTPRIRTDTSGRPAGVEIIPNDVRRVLARIPAVYRHLPSRVRWCLGREIRRYLSRGWTTDQVIAILAAPMPGTVARPLLLARWRLAHNMIGTGPLLTPVQRAWDDAQTAAQRTATADEQHRRIDQLRSVTTESVRGRMLVALRARLPHRDGPHADETRALVHAARMASREHPDHDLAAAIDRWLAHHLPKPTSPDQSATAPEHGDCVACGGTGGVVREELPLRSLVCDACWSADQDLASAAA
ncbi:hypothetical protein [Nocardia sp. NPDC051570]|uniref:hypothetical protein n=1 Tax=Nocardia sp. NPDC051570 TaxID=3364324 RepID=UPI0037BC63CC